MRKKNRKLPLILIIITVLVVIAVIIYFAFIRRQRVQGVRIDPNQAKISEVVEFVSSMQSNEVSVILDKTVLTTAISDGPVILLDIDHLPDNWQNTLQTIWERSRITAKYPVKIDLRFKSPILTYGKE